MAERKHLVTVQIILSLFVVVGGFLFLRYRTATDMVRIDSPSRQLMGTFARLIAVAKDANAAESSIDAAFEKLLLVDKLMSDYKEDSQISIINKNAYAQPVKLTPPVFEVLQRSIELSQQTNGAFDITIGPLIDLWRQAEHTNSMPTQEQLALVRTKVGYKKLLLDTQARTIKFTAEGMRLDLGAIAKGYAVDLAAKAMKQTGAIGGLIDLGGDIRCFGTPPPGKENWVIALQQPPTAGKDVVTGQVMTILYLRDRAVVTSGDYQRFVTINNKKYSHIINPATAQSTQTLSSVTVIGKNAAHADTLATAVTVLGVEKGLQLIEETPDTEAILITSGPNPKTIKSTGADKYLK